MVHGRGLPPLVAIPSNHRSLTYHPKIYSFARKFVEGREKSVEARWTRHDDRAVDLKQIACDSAQSSGFRTHLREGRVKMFVLDIARSSKSTVSVWQAPSSLKKPLLFISQSRLEKGA